MKGYIKKLLREGLLENINLNLSKQIRSKQMGLKIDKELEGIFGKNIYRLYYDLSSGKQITPRNKKPKLRFDIDIIDRLRDEVEVILDKFNFTLVDFDKNIAKSNKAHGQKIKISKVLNNTDKTIFKQYVEYLGALSNPVSGNEKLYVVISRHSHDIAGMASKPKITSCEDLSEYTDISQTLIGYDEDYVDGQEGGGVEVWRTIQYSGIIFYLIRDGDWDINDPISRFLGDGICEFGNSYHFYGEFSNDFKNFVTEWLGHYRGNILNKYDLRTDKDLFNKPVKFFMDEIFKKHWIYGDADSDAMTYVYRGLIKHNRYDVISEFSDNEIIGMYSLFGGKIFKQFPNELKARVIKRLEEDLDKHIEFEEKMYSVLTSRPQTKEEAIRVYVKIYTDIFSNKDRGDRNSKWWERRKDLSKDLGIAKYNTYNKLYNSVEKLGGIDAIHGKHEELIQFIDKQG